MPFYEQNTVRAVSDGGALLGRQCIFFGTISTFGWSTACKLYIIMKIYSLHTDVTDR